MSKTPASVWRNPVHFLAFGLGSGAAPKAPGTFGTLAAIPLWFLVADLSYLSYVVFLLVTSVIGIWLCGKTSDDMGVHDHGGIVWDEFVGMWIALFAVPAGFAWIIFAFLLFRLFDIWKPWPIGWADRQVSGGLGIMLDDIIAGLMALGVLQAVNYIWF